MSKELAFTDDNDVVKYLDTTTAFNLALTADGVAFDLTNAKSILVKIANDDGYIMQQTIDLTTVTSPLGGTLSFPINQNIMNTLVPDDYDIEVWVTMNDGTQAIFPSDGTLGFSIEENLMSDTGEVIPTITLNDFQQQFNDLSSQMENAVHNVQKGDKGDKGDTGQGLEIKDRVSSVSNLPSTANEGDGYLVNEELYIWVNGAWKDCGPIQGPQGIQGIQGKTGTSVSSTTIQYQISNSATTAPTGTWSNTLIATTQVNPFLWTQVTLNYDDGTSKSFYLVSSKGDKGDKGDTGATGPVGPQGPVGAGLVVKGTVSNTSQLPTTGNQEGYCYFVGTDLYIWDAGAWKNCGSVSPDLSNYVTVTDLNNGLSSKVNVTDMRKPASDVAGIEEVNAKQDKIAYTPADDSTVLHISPKQVTGTDINTLLTGGYYQVMNGTNGFPGSDNFTIYQVIPINSTNGVQVAYKTTTANDVLGMRVWNYNSGSLGFTPWVSFADDSKVVHDNHDGTIQLNGNTFTPALLDSALNKNSQPIDTDVDTLVKPGMYYVSGSAPNNPFKANIMLENRIQYNWNTFEEVQISYKLLHESGIAVRYVSPNGSLTGGAMGEWVFLSDDSKVAHLSGANNFDTVPTVNNNPLLLASSLPADLARTSQLANFTDGLQKGGKDVATTADVTTAISTATANMVDSSKPTNFTAGLQKGGIDVATAADLKSVEASAWRQLDNKYIKDSNNGGFAHGTYVLYRLDTLNKRLLFMFTINALLAETTVTVDFSSVVSNISEPSLPSFDNYFAQNNNSNNTTTVSKNLLNIALTGGGGCANSLYSSSVGNSDFCFVNYDKLV